MVQCIKLFSAAMVIGLLTGVGSSEASPLGQTEGNYRFNPPRNDKSPSAETFTLWDEGGDSAESPTNIFETDSQAAAGESPTPPDGELDLNLDYIKGYFYDIKHMLTSPPRWNTTDWIKAGLVVGTTGFFFALDDDIDEFKQDNRSAGSDDLADVFEPFGNPVVVPSVMAGLYLYGDFSKNQKTRRVALLGMESFLVSQLFTAALKYSTARKRPYETDDDHDWVGFNDDHNSFPSGHSSAAFALATVFSSEYGDEYPLIPPIVYGAATLTAFSRVNDEQHWASDVFFGAALGYFTAKTILKLHSDADDPRYVVYPQVGSDVAGMVVSVQY